MDSVTPPPRKAGDDIRASLTTAGILPGDPLFSSYMALAEAIDGVDDLRNGLAYLRRDAGITEDQVKAICVRVVGGLHAFMPRVARVLDRRTTAIQGCALIAAFLAGAAVVYWGVDHADRGMQCGYNGGGQWMCWAPQPKR